jgi:hypothetical protein
MQSGQRRRIDLNACRGRTDAPRFVQRVACQSDRSGFSAEWPAARPRGSAMSEKKRILTGVRPTGPLHLGHYAGALDNWVKLQREYDCYFLIADYQVSDYAGDLPRVRNAVWEVALDWLAVGLDPEGSSFVIESMVPEQAELMTWLAWFMPVGMLERNPTLKAEMEAIERPRDATTRGKWIPVAFYIYQRAAAISVTRSLPFPIVRRLTCSRKPDEESPASQ